MERRDVLKLGALGAVAAGGLAIPLTERAAAKSASLLADRNMPRPYAAPFKRPPVLKPYHVQRDASGKELMRRYSVTAYGKDVSIVPGLPTRIWGYNGMFPGPTIKVDQNVRVELRVRNRLPATHPIFGHAFHTSTHLHGSASLPQYDGYASDLTRVGEYKTYLYPDYQGARTLWYHDHAVHYTAKNAYTGLAAHYHLSDKYDRAQLPQGEFDVPVTISDAMFAANGQLAYDDDGMKSLWGDVILVNGVPWPLMKVKRRVYRFRVLVTSISRSYRFRLSNGQPMVVVATDGGLVPVPQSVTRFRAGSAERYEVLVDFRNIPVGTKVDLLNDSNENNVDFDHTGKIMRFEVVDGAFDPTNNLVPARLDIGPIGTDTMGLTPSMAKRTTRMRLKHDDITNEWSLDGHTWQEVVDSRYTKVLANPQIDDVELWEIENSSGGWFHPMHIHLVDFKVLSRNGAPPHAWEKGPKDVVYVGEGETVKLLMHFTVGPGSSGGRYMIHCHNLVHEDHDMMAQFRVGNNPFDADPNDPIKAARPTWDTLAADAPTYEAPYPAGT